MSFSAAKRKGKNLAMQFLKDVDFSFGNITLLEKGHRWSNNSSMYSQLNSKSVYDQDRKLERILADKFLVGT